MPRGFLTIAFGGIDYLRMAESLVRSYRRFGTMTPFAVVTDRIHHKSLKNFDHVIRLEPSYGPGVAQKLFLDRYSPFDETIFIDSDCLFYRNPDDLWQYYTPHDDFGVKGWRYLRRGDANDYINNILTLSGHDRIPNLNGGIYYFRRTERAARVFDHARNVYARRKELELRPFKNAPLADETAIALALVACDVNLLPWDGGQAMDMTFEMEPEHRIDIRVPRSAFSVHNRNVEPIVVHFNVGAQYSELYLTECARIRYMATSLAPFADLFGRLECFCKNARRLARRGAEKSWKFVMRLPR